MLEFILTFVWAASDINLAANRARTEAEMSNSWAAFTRFAMLLAPESDLLCSAWPIGIDWRSSSSVVEILMNHQMAIGGAAVECANGAYERFCLASRPSAACLGQIFRQCGKFATLPQQMLPSHLCVKWVWSNTHFAIFPFFSLLTFSCFFGGCDTNFSRYAAYFPFEFRMFCFSCSHFYFHFEFSSIFHIVCPCLRLRHVFDICTRCGKCFARARTLLTAVDWYPQKYIKSVSKGEVGRGNWNMRIPIVHLYMHIYMPA